MGWEFINHTEPVARKEYTCQWCREKIEKGTKYYRYSGVFNGDWQDTKMHSECADASNKMLGGDDELPDCRMKRGTCLEWHEDEEDKGVG